MVDSSTYIRVKIFLVSIMALDIRAALLCLLLLDLEAHLNICPIDTYIAFE